jgi:hypothetical protein
LKNNKKIEKQIQFRQNNPVQSIRDQERFWSAWILLPVTDGVEFAAVWIKGAMAVGAPGSHWISLPRRTPVLAERRQPAPKGDLVTRLD